MAELGFKYTTLSPLSLGLLFDSALYFAWACQHLQLHFQSCIVSTAFLSPSPSHSQPPGARPLQAGKTTGSHMRRARSTDRSGHVLANSPGRKTLISIWNPAVGSELEMALLCLSHSLMPSHGLSLDLLEPPAWEKLKESQAQNISRLPGVAVCLEDSLHDCFSYC